MDRGWWIICGVLAFVVFLNIGIALSAVRYRKSNPQPLLGKSIKELLNPWNAEDQALDDLHQRVESLSKKDEHANGEQLG